MWYRRVARSKVFQVAVLAVPFFGLYPVLRSLPNAECAFLHYDYAGETENGAEYCGTNEAVYLNLERLRFPLEVVLNTSGLLRPGEPGDFTVSFKTVGGNFLKPWELAVVHTEKIHLLIIDASLDDYHHVHPEPIGMTGRYRFSMTPSRSGSYKLFAELVPLVSRSIVVGKTTFDVGGPSFAVTPGSNYESEVEEFRFILERGGGPLRLSVNNELKLKIARSQTGELVRLDRVMGTFAHLVAFDRNRNGFAHMHPVDDGVGLGTEEASFGFSLNTDAPGYYRLWAQVRADGRDIFAPFDIIIDG